MRKLILSMLLAVSITFAFAQKNPFEQFADMEGVTSVYISKTMLSCHRFLFLHPKTKKLLRKCFPWLTTV